MDADTERRPVVAIAVVVALGCFGWFFVRPAIASSPAPLPMTTGSVTIEPAASAVADSADIDEVAVSSRDTADSVPPVSTAPEPEPAAAPVTTVAPPVDADAEAVAVPGADQVVEQSYPTLPDGSPSPIIAIYDTETITLTGVVPSESSLQRLETLAIANSRFPGASLISLLTVDETVPTTIGVRVIEKTSSRFPDGSAQVTPDHAAELERAAALMNALDHVTVLVIGHADQRGDAAANYQLSEDRARSVVRYLVDAGIDPSRLSSRAVGEADLITLDDDEMALALNRRTEFVFYGVLLE